MSSAIEWPVSLDDAYSTDEASSKARLSRVRLAALRLDGSGPPYVVVVASRRVFYPKAHFDAWVTGRISAPRRSTSDVAAR